MFFFHDKIFCFILFPVKGWSTFLNKKEKTFLAVFLQNYLSLYGAFRELRTLNTEVKFLKACEYFEKLRNISKLFSNIWNITVKYPSNFNPLLFQKTFWKIFENIFEHAPASDCLIFNFWKNFQSKIFQQ